VRITYTDIIAKAVGRALQDHPYLNSTLVDNKITLHSQIHLGIAVSLGEGGLVVPVLRDVPTKGLPQISEEIKSLASKARENKLGPDEMSGATFTITNLGTYGVETFTPIISPPQCAILGVCAIKDKPVIVDGACVSRPIMNLCLSFDHRITDGAPAAAFLARLKEILEQPYLIFA
jgi:pyruvate dehydrogenase E2 component (dihydrolipoamide acetyltransferase)